MATPTREDIAQRAQQLKTVYLALVPSSIAIAHPAMPLMQFLQAMTQAGPGDDVPIVLPDDGRRTEMVFSGREVLAAATKLDGEVLSRDLMSIGMLWAAIRLGDMIMHGGLHDPNEPLLEFARHFRNACAHGDRWFFKGDEPRRPARCRDLTITVALQGKRATWDTVGPRLFVEYLDDLSNHFVPGCIPPPATSVG